MWGENWGAMIWGNPNGVIPVAIPIDGIWLFILGIILGATAIIARRNKMARLASFSFILIVPVVAAFAVNLPHTFSNGTIADADEVNDNFQTLTESINDLEGSILVRTNCVWTPCLDTPLANPNVCSGNKVLASVDISTDDNEGPTACGNSVSDLDNARFLCCDMVLQ